MPIVLFVIILPSLAVATIALMVEDVYEYGCLGIVILLSCIAWISLAYNTPVEILDTQYVEAVHKPEQSYIVYNYNRSLHVSNVSGTAKQYRVDQLKTTYYGIDFSYRQSDNIKITPVIGDNQ